MTTIDVTNNNNGCWKCVRRMHAPFVYTIGTVERVVGYGSIEVGTMIVVVGTTLNLFNGNCLLRFLDAKGRLLDLLIHNTFLTKKFQRLTE